MFVSVSYTRKNDSLLVHRLSDLRADASLITGFEGRSFSALNIKFKLTIPNIDKPLTASHAKPHPSRPP